MSKKLALYTISIASQLSGIQPRALRLYEEMGLIRPQRKTKGHRLYSQEEIELLFFIRHLAEVRKINLAGIRFILGMLDRFQIDLDFDEGI
jgi:MerR family transcriptional regulator/heat shock protein HspR